MTHYTNNYNCNYCYSYSYCVHTSYTMGHNWADIVLTETDIIPVVFNPLLERFTWQ